MLFKNLKWKFGLCPIVFGEQLFGWPIHPMAFGQHAHPRVAVDESGRFRGGTRGPMRRWPGPVQRTRLWLEPQLPGLLQTKQQERATGNWCRQGMDVQDTVRAVWWTSRGRPSGKLSVRQYSQFKWVDYMILTYL